MNADASSSTRRPSVTIERRSRRLGLLGVAIGATVVVTGAFGGLVQAGAADAGSPGPSATVATPAPVRTAAVLDGWEAAARQAGGAPAATPVVEVTTGTAPAAVLDQTVAPATLPPPAPVPPLPPDAVARIVVASIGLDLPVYRGSQNVIDRGVATLFDDGAGGWRPPVAPGASGTLWIAGHHTSHGAPFLLVDQIPVGADIVVFDAFGGQHDYEIVDRDVVGTAVDPAAVYGTDEAASRLVLQTSMGSSHRLLLTGTLRS